MVELIFEEDISGEKEPNSGSCGSCNWSGELVGLDTEIEQDGWENPEYTVTLCPKCSDVLDHFFYTPFPSPTDNTEEVMNVYADAIEILKSCDDRNCVALIYEIAKKNPSALVQAQRRLSGPSVIEEVKKMASEGRSKIECIKYHRGATGSSLIQAKEAVESAHSF